MNIFNTLKRIALTVLSLVSLQLVTFATGVTFTYVDSDDSDAAKIFDGNLLNYWWNRLGSSVVFEASEKVSVSGYKFLTTDDADEYAYANPSGWKLSATNALDSYGNPTDWILIDEKSDDYTIAAEISQWYEFSIVKTTELYKYFKLEITGNQAPECPECSVSFQIAEFTLLYETCTNHTYENDICTICGRMNPNHICATYTNYVCDVCGLVDPTILPHSADGYYEISTLEQLQLWGTAIVSVDSLSKARLMADIVLNEHVLAADGKSLQNDASTYTQWVPIEFFSGVFDGNGHTISGLYINDETAICVGLFSKVGTATIRNLGVRDSYVVGAGSVGTILGEQIKCDDSKYTILENCYTEGYVAAVNSDNDYAGGLCGKGYTLEMTDCHNNGYVEGLNSASFIGGLAGYTYQSVLLRCYNEGDISGYDQTNFVGGLVGRIGYEFTVKDSYNAGTIYDEWCGAGGFASSTYYNKFSNSFNVGNVTSDNCNVGPYVADFSTNTYQGIFYKSGCTTGRYPYNSYDRFLEGETEASKFSSGELCYLLNGSVDNGKHFYQNLTGENIDLYPVLDSTHKTVMLGTHGAYINPCTSHTFENDIMVCTICDTITLTKNATGEFEIGSAQDLLTFAYYVNEDEGHEDAKAILTADIDLKDITIVPMGTETNPFVGSFNGAGHHISNMVIDNQTKEAQGLFGYVGDACAISNVVIDNSCSIKAKSKSAALVGVVAGSGDITISGCSNYATITGENYMAGLVGYNSSLTASVTIENCLNAGNVTITAAEGYAGAIAASLGENATIENCLNVGTITGANTALARINTGTITNCYQIDTETAQANVTAVSAAELASGLICYNLNEQTTTNPIWYQTLESDDFPVLDALHSEIHLSGEKNCDGSIKSAMVYTNEAEDLVAQDEHQLVAGICFVCNACDMDFVEKEGDYFLIGNADQLYWFSKYVENGNTAAKAKLTADIIVNDNLDASTAKVWRPIGSESNAFAGEFDGDGHTVSGLYVDDATTNNIGLIGYANGATIANVGIEDSYLNGYKNIGAICGFAIGTTISHCFNNAAVSGVDAVGGVLGCANTNTVKVKYSYNEGTVTGSRNYAAGVVGYCRLAAVTIENCYNVGTVAGNAYVAGISGYKGSISKSFNYTAIVGNNYVGNIVGEFDGTLSDNYYLETLDIDVNAEAKSTDFFANGELAYVLNGSATDAPVWYQTIGTDNYPVLDNSHSVIHTYLEKNCSGVAKGDVQYVNTDEDQIVQDEHIFVDGMCSICGSACDGFMTPNEDGIFEIANAGELRWFASYVNTGNSSAKAKLVADIVLNENVLNEDYTLNGNGKNFVQWTPIGNYSVPFSGSIDGQNHTISGLYFNGPGEYIGLVGYMEGNAGGVAINNLGIINSYIAVEGKGQYVGGFIGSSYCNAAIESCYFNGAISSNNASVGGIIGETSSMDITNCYTEGRIYAKAGNVGGIVGEYSQKTVSNCHNSAMVSSSGDYVGGIVGRAVVDFVYSHRNVATIKDSYNEGEILGTSYVGGICGDHSNYNISERDIRSVYLSNCYNAGKISGSSYVGGIAGKNNLGLTNVQNLATVNGTEEYVGGIVGYGNFVSTAINTGVVTCNGKTTRVGAIAGSISENGGVLSAIYDKDVTSYKGINNDASWEDFVPLSPKSMQAFGLTTEQLCKGQLEGNSETRGWTQNDFFDNYSHIIDVNDNVVDSTLNKRAWSRGNFDVAASNIVTTDNEFGVSQKGLYPYLSSFSYRPAATIKFYNFGDEEDTNWKTYRPIVQVSELYAITTSESDLSANYVLMCDIADYENLDANGKLLDTPVNTWPGIGYCIRSGGLPAEEGDYYEPFRGYFAGRGHTISGLSLISNAGQATNGLINTAENATITGVTIKNSNLANEYLLSSGMICGFAKNTTISDCKSYCNLEGDNYDRVGGICGILKNGIVKDCYNYGSISSSGYYIGGIVGSSSGTIMHSGNYGDISSSYNVGGIVGVGGSINYCYNKGTITAHHIATTGSRQGNCAGGIAGIYGTIANCFNVGTIKADENAGGLVGGYATSITSSYNIGSVSGTDAKTAGLGSLVGASSGNTKLSYNYNDTLKCNIGAVDGINTPGSGEGIATIDFCGTLPKGFSPSIWAIRPAEMEGLKNKNYYPYLRYWGPDSAMVAVVVETYQITLEFNGGIAKGTVPTSYASGIGVELPTEVTQNGYAFAGWYSNSNFTSEIYTKVDQTAIGNKIFYARWIADVYDVALNTNDGRINSGNVASYTFGNNVILPLDVTRTGYTFAGWYDTEDCSGDRILQISAKEFGNKEYWAKWNVVDYTITYNVNGGTINDTDYASAFQYALAEVSLPSDVTRTGYTFAGWYDNSNLNGEPVTSIATTEYGNKEYWAKWDVNTYKVTLDVNDGNINSGNLVMYVYDVLSILPADVTKVGYTFGGWYADEACSGSQVLQISKGEFGDKKFYAKWTANNYKITLVVNDGTINAGSVSEYTYGEGATLPTDVTRIGYEFDGWYTTSYFDNSNVLTIGTNDFGDKTYWAKWSVASYDVDLIANGGTINDGTIDSYTFGVGAILPTNVTKIGYEFTGWYTNAECTGTPVKEITTADIDDLSFYAGWKKAVYTISFDNNGGTIKDESYATTYSYDVEKSVALPSTVEKAGCTFAGWYDNVNLTGESLTTVAAGEYGDKTYYAQWTPNTYTVTLNTNDGVVNSGDINSYVYGVVATLPTDVTKDGYTFMGWYDNADLTGSTVSIISSTSIGNQTFYANWSTNAYTVTLNTNDGVVKTNSITGYVYGTGATLPGTNDVEKTGYTFAGWYDNSSYAGTAVTEISKTETGNKSFWAKWSVNSYSIALTLNGGTINSGNVTNYVYGNGANLPSDVTKAGNTFSGWYAKDDFSGESVIRIDESTTGDVAFFAKWTANDYAIVYETSAGVISDASYAQTYTYGTGAMLPQAVEKPGYAFVGWYTNSAYEGSVVSEISKTEYGNKTFYAKWSVNRYAVELNANQGTINSGDIVEYTFGVGATLPTNVTKTGYTFVGWYDNEEFGGEPVKAIANNVVGDKTYFAKWSINSYDVTLNANGGVINSGDVTAYEFGTKTTLPTDVTRTGYTFAGWYNNSNLTGKKQIEISATTTGNVSYFAKWNVNSYVVTLNANEGTINSGNVTNYVYGNGATLPSDVTKAGNTFGGWFNVTDSTKQVVRIDEETTGDQSFFAKWTANNYAVTMNANGGVINSGDVTTYEFGTKTTLPIDVTRTGYTFAGWYNNSNLTGEKQTEISATTTGNVSYFAKWNVNNYAVMLNANEGTINSGNVTNYVYGNGANLPSDVTKTGYKFAGWYNVTDSTKQVVRIDEETTGDQAFFAKWTANSYNVILVVNEGTINEGNVESYEYGEGATLPSDVTKTGYTFDGWYSNSSYTGGSVSTIAKNDVGDKQFWAKWSINEYVVNAVAENGTVEGTGSYEYKSTATLKATANDGYEFVNWSNGSSDNKIQIVVTKDTTVTANFKEKEKVAVVGTLTIPTMKTEREAAPIDLTGLFTTTEGSEVICTASSSRPDVVAVSVVEGKLLFAVSALEGEAEITVTATLPNGEKNSVSATASVVLACNIQVAETIKNVSCYGESDGEISVVVENAFEPYTIQWIGVDNTNDTLPALIAGNYTIDIADAEGCTFQKTYTVVQPQEIVISKSVINPTCANADGSITINVTGGADFTYIWNNDTTSRSLENIAKGEYNLVVVNNETGCKAETSVVLTEPDAPVVKVADVIETACNANNGAVIISGADNLIYKWNIGRATKNLMNMKAGDYKLEVIDPMTNCKDSIAVTIPSIPLKQPEISLVTVSQETGKNLVVWLKENTDLIDYYTVYRQSDEKGRYEALDKISYNDLSVYEDLEADPMIQPWSYRMTATDVCGQETEMSESHRTLHLQKNLGMNDVINLDWTAYEGIDYSTFVILRETTIKGKKDVDTLATVSADVTTYTDIIPAEGTSSYYVGIKLPSEVNPKTQFMKAESGPFSLALSNIAEAENEDVDNPTGIEDVENAVVVYAIGHTIYVTNAEGNDITIYDNNGRNVSHTSTNNTSNVMQFDVRLDGTYFVKVGNESFAVIVK
ncbi:MAG: InlB B-repeat-containing protein [Bacteroidales bacterium]|nr:InlB B-repeat-containing protein [Bacteroidales bacterium]